MLHEKSKIKYTKMLIEYSWTSQHEWPFNVERKKRQTDKQTKKPVPASMRFFRPMHLSFRKLQHSPFPIFLDAGQNLPVLFCAMMGFLTLHPPQVTSLPWDWQSYQVNSSILAFVHSVVMLPFSMLFSGQMLRFAACLPWSLLSTYLLA